MPRDRFSVPREDLTFSNRVQFRGRHFEAVTSSQSRPHPSGTTCARRRTLSDPRCTHSPRTPQLRCPGKIVFGADVLVSAPNSRRDSSNVRPNKHLRSFFAFPFIVIFFRAYVLSFASASRLSSSGLAVSDFRDFDLLFYRPPSSFVAGHVPVACFRFEAVSFTPCVHNTNKEMVEFVVRERSCRTSSSLCKRFVCT